MTRIYAGLLARLMREEIRRQDIARAREAEKVIERAADAVLGVRGGRSAPGRPPGMRSGRLRASVRPVVTPGDVLNADFKAACGYAGFLERGTRFMAARPYRVAILNRARAGLIEIAGRAYRMPNGSNLRI